MLEYMRRGLCFVVRFTCAVDMMLSLSESQIYIRS